MKPEILGTRIQQARSAMGLSPRQLATRMSVKPSTVEKWEQNRTEPRGNKLVMLAGVLGVPVLWLLDGEIPAGADFDLHFDETGLAVQKLERAVALQGQLAALLIDISADVARLQRRLDDAKEDADLERHDAAA